MSQTVGPISYQPYRDQWYTDQGERMYSNGDIGRIYGIIKIYQTLGHSVSTQNYINYGITFENVRNI